MDLRHAASILGSKSTPKKRASSRANLAKARRKPHAKKAKASQKKDTT